VPSRAQVRREPRRSLTVLKGRIKDTYKEDVSDNRVRAVKRAARRQWFIDECVTFRQFPAFMQIFKQQDPLCHVALRVEEGGFHSFFFAPGALRFAQLQLRAVVGLDGTFSKCKWQYVMLAATSMDANDGVILLAAAQYPQRVLTLGGGSCRTSRWPFQVSGGRGGRRGGRVERRGEERRQWWPLSLSLMMAT